MKIAGGCFGCLTLIFLILTMATGSILAYVFQAAPELATSVGPFAGYIQYINTSCCCLSGLLSVVLLGVGFMGGKKDEASE